ncbi:MAG TPA: dienelactone hydrolase family protein [Candidatus Dormibacteraeota bacterium]|nr:dienelactone hydrolase family protein [Candidatus Dormibacteraeota bacterium]
MAEVSFPTPAGTGRGYFAVPPGDGPWPGVVVIMDAFGMSRDLRQQCERLASSGFLALAPDLYAWGAKVICVGATLASLRRGGGRPVLEIGAARDWVAARSDCSGDVGVIGFCMGGGFALLVAPGGGFSVASVNYGQLPRNAERRLQGSCPVVASYGGRDRTLRGQSGRLRGILQGLGIEHDIREYDRVGHGFMNRHDGRLGKVLGAVGMRYDEAAAEDSWRRILSFFDNHLRKEGAGAPPARNLARDWPQLGEHVPSE